MLGHALPLKDRPVNEHTGSKPTPVECVREIMANVNTAVLATVFVSGWKLYWLSSITMMVLNSYSTCSYLFLHAISGGEFINADEGTPPEERRVATK